jgi:hypothetical protein
MTQPPVAQTLTPRRRTGRKAGARFVRVWHHEGSSIAPSAACTEATIEKDTRAVKRRRREAPGGCGLMVPNAHKSATPPRHFAA